MENNNTVAFKATMNNLHTCGVVQFAEIPVELLEIDFDYQRVINNREMQNKIATDFQKEKVGMLLVSAHPSTGTFKVVDGQNRLMAMKKLGFESVACQVVCIDGTENEIKVREAELFADQDDNKKRVSLEDKHKARVLQGITEYVDLDDLLKKYRIHLKNCRLDSAYKVGVLGAYRKSVNIIRSNGKESLDWIFSVIDDLGWNTLKGAYKHSIIASLHKIYLQYETPEEREVIKKVLLKVLDDETPNGLIIKAKGKYEYINETTCVLKYESELIKDGFVRRVHIA